MQDSIFNSGGLDFNLPTGSSSQPKAESSMPQTGGIAFNIPDKSASPCIIKVVGVGGGGGNAVHLMCREGVGAVR